MIPLLFALACSPLLAQQTFDVFDLNPTVSGIVPPKVSSSRAPGETQMIQVGAHWYFTNTTAATGYEIFRTDGNQVELAIEMAPGIDSSNPTSLTPFNGEFVFFANSGPGTIYSLWKSDGTQAGTTELVELSQEPYYSWTFPVVTLGNQILFSNIDQVNGRELWVSDGTPQGTALLMDTIPGSQSGYPTGMTLNPAGDKALFFSAISADQFALWETDGTTLGTQQVFAFDPHTESAYYHPVALAHSGAKLSFRGFDQVHGHELWVTDGTTGGTALLKDLSPGSTSSYPDLTDTAELNGALHFLATEPFVSSQIWSTDGTANGTNLIVDANLGQDGSGPSNLTAVNNSLFYTAYSYTGPFASDPQLWWYNNGVAELFHSAKLMNTAGAYAYANELFAFNDKLYFTAEHDQLGYELHSASDSLGSVQLVKDIQPGSASGWPVQMTPLDANHFFITTSLQFENQEFWKSDGTEAGTTLFHHFEPTNFTADSNPRTFADLDGLSTVFRAKVGNHERLHRYTKQAGATSVFANPEDSPIVISVFTEAWVGNAKRLFFTGETGSGDFGLWVTDGTESGTINLGVAQDEFNSAIHFDGQRIIFQGKPNQTGKSKLYISDGTLLGTESISGYISVPGTSMATLAGLTYFVGENASLGQELWVTAGAKTTSVPFADIKPGFGSSNIKHLTTVGDRLAFSANALVLGQELWTSDGTVNGTNLVLNIRPGSASSSPTRLFEFNQRVFFVANDGTNGDELWSSDLTASGTHLLADIMAGTGTSIPRELVQMGDRLLFVATTSLGTDIWQTDGTPTGTQIFSLLNATTYVSNLVPAGDGVIFAAHMPGLIGDLFFVNAGNPVMMLANADPIYGYTKPNTIAWAAGQLLFPADDPLYGYELHAMALDLAFVQDLGISGSGAKLSATPPVMGSNMTIKCDQAPTGPLGVIAYSPPVVNASAGLTLPGHAAWLDMSQVSLFDFFMGPAYSNTFGVPANPSLAGAQINVQAWFLGAGLFPAATSNGLTLRVGN